jgi:O-antigen/teichoic acid export membrane protein
VLRILIWYTAIAMTANVFAQGLVVQNRQRGLLVIRASGLAINITLNALLIPRIGIVGAAMASLSAELLVLLALVYGFQSIQWAQLLPRLLRLALLTVAVGAGMLVLGQVHAVAGMVMGPLFYAVGITQVLAPDDWDLLYRLVAAMPGGTFIRRFWRRDVAINW